MHLEANQLAHETINGKQKLQVLTHNTEEQRVNSNNANHNYGVVEKKGENLRLFFGKTGKSSKALDQPYKVQNTNYIFQIHRTNNQMQRNTMPSTFSTVFMRISR